MSTNSNKLAGKVAVVTGASKGIGAAIAKALATEAAAVTVNYSSSKADGGKVVNEISALGGKAIAVQANISKQMEIDRLFAKTEKTFGRLDILVNSAGIHEFAPPESVTEENFHKQFNLNMLGLILASQAAAKLFDSAGGRFSLSLPMGEGRGEGEYFSKSEVVFAGGLSRWNALSALWHCPSRAPSPLGWAGMKGAFGAPRCAAAAAAARSTKPEMSNQGNNLN